MSATLSDFYVAPTAAKPVEAPAAPLEPKVNPPHAWAGKAVFFWRVTNQRTGEISPLPAMLIQPTTTLGATGWDINFYRIGQMQGRPNCKHSDRPRAGCWTWPETPPAPAPVPEPHASKRTNRAGTAPVPQPNTDTPRA